MPEPTIEEAWGPFAVLKRRMGKDRAQEAARALALAVLREMQAMREHHPWSPAMLSLEKRILALGRDDGE